MTPDQIRRHEQRELDAAQEADEARADAVRARQHADKLRADREQQHAERMKRLHERMGGVVKYNEFPGVVAPVVRAQLRDFDRLMGDITEPHHTAAAVKVIGSEISKLLRSDYPQAPEGEGVALDRLTLQDMRDDTMGGGAFKWSAARAYDQLCYARDVCLTSGAFRDPWQVAANELTAEDLERAIRFAPSLHQVRELEARITSAVSMYRSVLHAIRSDVQAMRREAKQND